MSEDEENMEEPTVEEPATNVEVESEANEGASTIPDGDEGSSMTSEEPATAGCRWY